MSRGRSPIWTKESVLQAIREMEHRSANVDSRLTNAAVYRFGSWNNAVEAAGVAPFAYSARLELNCVQCGGPFNVEKSRKNPRFCSLRCKHESQRKERVVSTKPRRQGKKLQEWERFVFTNCAQCYVRFAIDLAESKSMDGRKFCSSDCRYAAGSESRPRPPRIIPDCTCKGCGITFRPKGADRMKYCSRECFFEHNPRRKRREPKPEPVTVECERCATPFVQGVRRKYCSRACAAYQPRPLHSKECLICGRRFEGQSRARFCSSDCNKTAKRMTDWLGLKGTQELTAVPEPLFHATVLYRKLNQEIAKRYA